MTDKIKPLRDKALEEHNWIMWYKNEWWMNGEMLQKDKYFSNHVKAYNKTTNKISKHLVELEKLNKLRKDFKIKQAHKQYKLL